MCLTRLCAAPAPNQLCTTIAQEFSIKMREKGVYLERAEYLPNPFRGLFLIDADV